MKDSGFLKVTFADDVTIGNVVNKGLSVVSFASVDGYKISNGKFDASSTESSETDSEQIKEVKAYVWAGTGTKNLQINLYTEKDGVKTFLTQEQVQAFINNSGLKASDISIDGYTATSFVNTEKVDGKNKSVYAGQAALKITEAMTDNSSLQGKGFIKVTFDDITIGNNINKSSEIKVTGLNDDYSITVDENGKDLPEKEFSTASTTVTIAKANAAKIIVNKDKVEDGYVSVSVGAVDTINWNEYIAYADSAGNIIKDENDNPIAIDSSEITEIDVQEVTDSGDAQKPDASGDAQKPDASGDAQESSKGEVNGEDTGDNKTEEGKPEVQADETQTPELPPDSAGEEPPAGGVGGTPDAAEPAEGETTPVDTLVDGKTYQVKLTVETANVTNVTNEGEKATFTVEFKVKATASDSGTGNPPSGNQPSGNQPSGNQPSDNQPSETPNPEEPSAPSEPSTPGADPVNPDQSQVGTPETPDDSTGTPITPSDNITTVVTNTDGTSTATTEVSVTGSDAAVTVVVNKDTSGVITAATANVETTAASKAIDGSVIQAIKEAAGTDDVLVTVKVANEDGTVASTIRVNASDVESGSKLQVVKIVNGERVLVNAKNYKVNEDGSISISMSDGGTYRLLNASDMNKVNKKILATVQVKKASTSVEKNKTTKIALKKSLNMDNVKSIKYMTSKKAVATVTKKGVVKAKKSGNAVIKAKITLKSGKTKTVKMKVKVK